MGEKRLRTFLAEYKDLEVDEAYLALYEDQGNFDRVFASLHQRLDSEFDWMNYKARNGHPGHFNAENSRTLLDLIDEVAELNRTLQKAGWSVELASEYQRVLTGAKDWLVPSGGSPVPEGFTPVLLDKYEAAFLLSDSTISLPDSSKSELTVVGEGAYAIVHKYTDPNYGITFARKKLKRGADDEEVGRFRREYEIMRNLDFPYILQVYLFNEVDNYYTMEYCDSTLDEYVKRRNNQKDFSFDVRRRIALQLLFGLNFLHYKGIYHRDLSLKNILLRVFSDGAVTVKLSDFGLAKQTGSDLTKTEAEIRGTIVDPALEVFKGFQPVNDIYAVGFLLSYIFKGTKSLISDGTALGSIVHKCSNSNPTLRYQNVLQIIKAVESLEVEPLGTPA